MTYLELRRKIGISTIFSGFISFGVSLLISNFKVNLPSRMQFIPTSNEVLQEYDYDIHLHDSPTVG